MAPGHRHLLVSDARGIVFIANQPGWRYRLLEALSPTDLAELKATRQYDKQTLVPLPHERLRRFDDNSYLVRVEGPDGPAQYLWESLPLSTEGWTLHLLRRPQVALGTAQRRTGRRRRVADAGVCAAVPQPALAYRQAAPAQPRGTGTPGVEERTRELRTARTAWCNRPNSPPWGRCRRPLAHEINQPLTAQRMQLATLRLLLDHGRVDDAYKALRPLDDMLTRMAALTGHLKTFARKSPSGLREPLDLAAVVDQAMHLLKLRLRDEQIHCTVDLVRPARVRGDAIRLEQVLINLLRNALDAMRDKPLKRLHIRLEADQQLWRLSVTDSGGGIDEQDLPNVFDPFFTTKPVGDGLGLGLAVSFAIIHELGGRLTAENHGDGTRFTVTLPVDLEAQI